MTQDTVSIRFATEADARQIAEVHDAASQAIYRGLLPDEVLAYFSATRREALSNKECRMLKDLTVPSTFVIRHSAVRYSKNTLNP